MVPTEELEGYGRPQRTRRRLALVVVLVCSCVVAYLALRPATREEPPRFRLPLLSGGALSSEELEGDPVVLNFFASWCAPCREEAPRLEAAWREHRDAGVRMVGVDVNDTEEGARRFVREFGITYPVVRDVDDQLIGELGVRGLPQTFFITRDWELLNVASGERVGAETREVVPLGAIYRRELETNIQRLLHQS
jgi:cytochrome c biogenesis protein CcmG/thiol:disulfide interchange protein DsbE